MNDPKKLFGIPKEHQIDRTEFLANDGSIYVWQITTIWVDIGDSIWRKHQYEAWRMRVGEGYTDALSGFDVPREVLEAQDPYARPPDGTLTDPDEGPEPDEDDFWVEGPTVYYADEPEEDPEPEPEIDWDVYEPEEIPPEELSDVDDA